MASYFRNNLHIVLCMSPVGSAFRTRCRMFPSLVNCCTIDWFTEWPPEALLSVSQSAFAEVDLGTDELKVCLTPRQETDSSLWILCLRSSKFEKFRNGKQVTKLHSQSRNYTQQILGKHLIRLHFSCLRGIVSCIYRKYVCSLNITMGSTFFRTAKNRRNVYGDTHKRQWYGGKILQRIETQILYDAHKLLGTHHIVSYYDKGKEEVSNSIFWRRYFWWNRWIHSEFNFQIFITS